MTTARAKYIPLIFLLACAPVLFASSPEKQLPVDPSAKTSAAQESEDGTLTAGIEQRVRNEDWNNITDFNAQTDDERRQMRYRTRIWANYANDSFEFNVGWADEFYKKYALEPADVAADRLNLDEVVFETLSLKLKKLLIPGLSLKVGRQDIPRGEGFLLFDGTSGDGSRTSYFNAADLSYQQRGSKVELLGILDPKVDRFLPAIHNQHKKMNEWDEQALGLYYTNRSNKSEDLDAYYIYKKEIKDYRSPSNPLFQPDRNISTAGARLVKRFGNGYSVAGEFADQWGGQHGNPTTGTAAEDIRAGGGYLYARKSFDTAWKPKVTVGYWALSGDDPNSHTLNGFDPLFARWPKYSEMVLYTMIPERGVGYWTNNRMLQLELTLNPIKPLTIRTTFYNQDAFHPSNKSSIFSTGLHRGENYQVRADYTITPEWRAHILLETYSPGSFYAGHDSSYFFQVQMVRSFSTAFSPERLKFWRH